MGTHTHTHTYTQTITKWRMYMELQIEKKATQDEKKQFTKLIMLYEKQCMLQVIEEPTREENTLDLLFTNEVSIITELELNKSAISDHNRIELNTKYRIREEILQQNYQKIDWDLIIKHIKDMKWKNICERGVAIEVIELLLSKLNEICLDNAPKRN